MSATNNFATPSSTVLTKLWYSTTATGQRVQIAGVQAIPPIIPPREDITYRMLESDIEYAVKGIRPFEAIEVETILHVEQYRVLEGLASDNSELFWFVELPTDGANSMVIRWTGTIDVSLAEIQLDDMLRSIIKIGKSSNPEIVDSIGP